MIEAILHIDLDAFFVSVEQVLHPELRGKPVIVGGRPERRGVVASASYEARAFGIRSAMSLARAYQLCPDAVFMQGNYTNYSEFSRKFMAILAAFSPSLEPGGLDEAYLDVTGCDIFGTPRDIAIRIKQRVREELQLTASVGIASCKIVAKVASDYGKPDGLVEVPRGQERRFLAPLPMGRLPGIGTKTEQKLKSLGFNTIGQIAELPQSILKQKFGSYGAILQQHARGIDYSQVESVDEAKSISRETTFSHDIVDEGHLHATLRYLCEKVGAELREAGKQAKSVSLKLRFADFETISRSRSSVEAFSTDDAIYKLAGELLSRALGSKKKYIRLIGVEVSSLTGDAKQTGLFDYQKLREERRSQAIDRIRQKYGFNAVYTGRTIALKQIFKN